MKSLEFATDLLAMGGESTAEHLPDRIIQRTPASPDFWFGNRVLFREPPEDGPALIARFQADFPQARHVCLGWDVPGLDPEIVQRAFAGLGLEIGSEDVLVLDGPVRQVRPPAGIEIRALGPRDWAQSEEIAFDQNMKEGLPEAGMRAYLAKQSAARQRQIAQGRGQWFGAFDGDRLVGDMGIFHDDKLIRYQSVQTHPAYRRRGICSALLCHAMNWAGARAPEARAVIVAAADSDAGRLYRRAGFALAETSVSAFRAPK